MDEPVSSFDTNGLFGAFGGVIGEETGDIAFIIEEGPAEGLGARKRITRGLAAMIYCLMVAMIHHL